MDCFIRSKHLSSWAGLCFGNFDHAGKKKWSYPLVQPLYQTYSSEIANSARFTARKEKGLGSFLVNRGGQLLAAMARFVGCWR